MPPKKKGGSKMARMSEEEKLRYLAHRAEIELEAKRRKQQLISVFTKNKLKREETFARLNTAKINEQWRFILRQVKCKELYEDLEYLWKNFDRILTLKNTIIQKLYGELEKADVDHRRLQEAHMETIDLLILRHQIRLKGLKDNYLEDVNRVEIGEIDEMNSVKGELSGDCKHLEAVIFAQNNFIEGRLAETKMRNAVNTFSIEHSKDEAISQIKRTIGGKIDDLWCRLNRVITDYQSKMQKKRKQYETLKSLDDAHHQEATKFPRHQSTLLTTMESLKNEESKLWNERNHTIGELKIQWENLNSRIWKLRQTIRMDQTMDRGQLKKLTVMSGSVIKEMKKIEEKSSMILLLMRICTSLEVKPLCLKKFNWGEANDESTSTGVMSPYDKLENFWEQFNDVKAEVIAIKREKNVVMAENKRLRASLKTYLVTVARMPGSRPQTSI
ncbi:coiled-coil domain-containing protein 65 [Fopius arisanus]|uniref:Dynein regulatory complex subunit 2 n=1 Tax=Fopius arisanus TaxID=64838 RepID=A0A9R1TGG3_9HYME|nr:PREDICTED: coiled-coil domain-containing protein 65 [Fopius arisanus]